MTDVLQQASKRIAGDLEVFWATFFAHDTDSRGLMDISSAGRFFKDLFKAGYCRGWLRQVQGVRLDEG